MGRRGGRKEGRKESLEPGREVEGGKEEVKVAETKNMNH